MTLFANELSVDNQFRSLEEFRVAFSQVMAMRQRAQNFGFEVHCSRKFLYMMPIEGVPMQRALQCLSQDKIRSAMTWLTRGGPFMEDIRMHLPDHYLECDEEIVTCSSVGEAAIRTLNGLESALISATPSSWDYDPVVVKWRGEYEELDNKVVELPNWRNADRLEAALHDLLPEAKSWNDLKEISKRYFPNLIFADNCLDQLLKGTPFRSSVAQKFLLRFRILDRILQERDSNGKRTREGHRIIENFFHGDNALFSDSSPTEKRDFKNEMTFPHPIDSGKKLFCTWHGKVSTQSMRFHFSWPARSGEQIYVVYVGPKITKK